eukprot:Partr_v1_DN25990_c0_g1_i2_m68324 putative PRP19 PSO4 pre-mRNA processing factor 19 homolog (S. cerevisiae)
MICSLSGEIPEKPVCSVKTGHVYESRLIERHLAEHHKCPITNQPMSTADLIPLQTSTIPQPRTPSATSIPQLLNLLQVEWDALMLETFQLRKSYGESMRELSHALYQTDAAGRVIARLLRERDQAREALTSLRAQLGDSVTVAGDEAATKGGEEMEVVGEQQLEEGVVAEISAKADSLTAWRKKRPAREHAAVTELESHSNLDLKGGPSGHLVAMDLCLNDDKQVLAAISGDKDKHVAVFSDVHGDKANIVTLKSHTKPVNALRWLTGECLVTGSEDKTCKLWSQKGAKWTASATLKHHSDAVTAVAIHPTQKYYLSVDSAANWSFNDGASSLACSKSEHTSAYTACEFHPDGLIFACGSDNGRVEIWDLKTQSIAFECPELHESAIVSMSFSENGYYFATASQHAVMVWDLRRLVKSWQLDIEKSDGGSVCVQFDPSASYLCVSQGSHVKIYQSKVWQLVKTLESSIEEISQLKFSPLDDSLILCPATTAAGLEIIAAKE